MFKAASKETVSGSLRVLAEYIDSTSQPSKHVVLAGLARIKMAIAQTAQEAVEAMGPLQAGGREEVENGFKRENPSLTDAQLKEIGDEWVKNKDQLKK